MPLIYSVNGFPAPYVLPPVHAVQPAFAGVLSDEIDREKFSDGELPVPHTHAPGGMRGYGAPPVLEHSRSPVVVAGQVMSSPPRCISPELSVAEARELMRKKRFRHLPVVSSDGKLIGIISDRDIFRSELAPIAGVQQSMSTKVLTATAETPIRQVAEALLQNRIGALPILDEDHKVIGILTTTDILKAVVQRAPLELWA